MANIPGTVQSSQASPPADGEPTRVAFVLVPENPELVREHPDDVEQVVRSGCGRSRLSDVGIEISGDGRVTVEATNSTEYVPSRVLHRTWTASEENYAAIPRPREAPRLTWARGGVIED